MAQTQNFSVLFPVSSITRGMYDVIGDLFSRLLFTKYHPVFVKYRPEKQWTYL